MLVSIPGAGGGPKIKTHATFAGTGYQRVNADLGVFVRDDGSLDGPQVHGATCASTSATRTHGSVSSPSAARSRWPSGMGRSQARLTVNPSRSRRRPAGIRSVSRSRSRRRRPAGERERRAVVRRLLRCCARDHDRDTCRNHQSRVSAAIACCRLAPCACRDVDAVDAILREEAHTTGREAARHSLTPVSQYRHPVDPPSCRRCNERKSAPRRVTGLRASARVDPTVMVDTVMNAIAPTVPRRRGSSLRAAAGRPRISSMAWSRHVDQAARPRTRPDSGRGLRIRRFRVESLRPRQTSPRTTEDASPRRVPSGSSVLATRLAGQLPVAFASVPDRHFWATPASPISRSYESRGAVASAV